MKDPDLFDTLLKPPAPPPARPGPPTEPPEPPSPLAGIPPEVVALFERLALQILAQGFERYSARAILHRIRWHYHIERGMREFKCNNNWTPRMARWVMEHNTRLADFFETRRSPHSEEDFDD